MHALITKSTEIDAAGATFTVHVVVEMTSDDRERLLTYGALPLAAALETSEEAFMHNPEVSYDYRDVRAAQQFVNQVHAGMKALTTYLAQAQNFTGVERALP